MARKLFAWADGFHPPKGVTAQKFGVAVNVLKRGGEPTPDRLLNASKDPKHCLYHSVWDEGDQVWATRGRLDYCRRVLHSLQEVTTVGGKDIQIRSVEYIKVGDKKKWVSLDDIRGSARNLRAYANEVQRLQEQALGKMAKLNELLNDEEP